MATTSSTTTSQLDPTIQPFLSYGLTEAQKLYEAGGPKYYSGDTFVRPSETTQTGLQALENRARMGSPLVGQAQQQISNTIGGNYLSGNPFFQGAFAPAAQAATQQFQTAIGDIGSAASKAGRYGSGAMGTLQDRASGQLAQSLSNTAGTLAYQNYADERARQQAATMSAPAFANADYQDIENLLSAGRAREGYTGRQLESDIARFNFGENRPQNNLATFLSSVYGNPLGNNRTTTMTGSTPGPSNFQNLLGGAATLGGLYRNTNGFAGLGNFLSGFGSGSGGSFTADPYAYSFGSNYWD